MHPVLEGLLVQAPLYVIVGLVIAAVVAWALEPLLYACVFLFVGLVFNLVLKHALYALFGDGTGDDGHGRHPALHRPTRCPGQRPDAPPGAACEQCGTVVVYGPPLHGAAFLGMPSGHVQGMCLVATAWTLHVLVPPGGGDAVSAAHAYASIALVWLWTAAVAFQRVHSGCHTWQQALVGAAVGVVLGGGCHVAVRACSARTEGGTVHVDASA